MPEYGFPFPFRPPSEEEQEQMKAREERRQMEISAFQHDFQTLFTEISEEQLKTLGIMFHIAGSPDSHHAWLWEAMISWELKRRFNICVTCGVNHDTELTTEKRPENTEPLFIDISDDEVDTPLPEMEVNGPLSFPANVREKMNEYHLDDAYEEDMTFRGFACTGIKGSHGPCGLIYPSIADRTLKGPEECSGCFQRMMHG